MSSTGSDDALRIPIEIKTEDSAEIQQMIAELAEAESDIRSVTPRRGRGRGDSSSRSAFTPSSEESGGIFGSMGGEAMPTQGRDKKSRTPFQRENEFSKLKDQVQQQEQKLGAAQKAQQGLGGLAEGLDYARTLASRSNMVGSLGKIAKSAVLPVAITMQIVGMIHSVIQEALKPGGPLDRRFKRIIGDEIAATADLNFKEEVNQGFKVIRISTQPGLRGESGVSSNLQRKTVMYDLGISRSMAGLQG
tara:strand:- start:2167 stop:2910 length:744 start_codon:yes stop_codon:yes gene_type:complete